MSLIGFWFSSTIDSIDAYRTQRQSKQPVVQSVTPAVQRRAPEKSQPQSSVNTKEKIMVCSIAFNYFLTTTITVSQY